jgi:hypothetical protein
MTGLPHIKFPALLPGQAVDACPWAGRNVATTSTEVFSLPIPFSFSGLLGTKRMACQNNNKKSVEPGVVVHIYNPSFWEAEAGGLQVQGHTSETLSQTKKQNQKQS